MNRRNYTLTLLLATCAIAEPGCQDKHIYSWGTYEPSIRTMYLEQADFKAPDEIRRLTGEIQKTAAEHRKVPPGKYAYVGYLYYIGGDATAARAYFAAEKKAFPESGQFVDRLIARMP